MAGIGLVLAIVGWWLRRGDRCRPVAARRRGRPPAARPLGASSRSCARPRPSTTTSSSASALDRVSPRPRTRLRLEEAHVAEIDQRRAQLTGLVGDEPAEALPALRDNGRPRDRAEDGGARGARADRQGAARPRAARGRGRRRRAPARAGPRRRGQRAGPGGAEPRRRRGGRRRSPSGSRAGREDLPALQRRERVYERTLARDRHGRAGDDGARDALPRAAHGRATSSGSPTAATGGSGSTTATSGSRSTRRSAATGSPVTELSQGTLDVVYLAARLGLVRLVTGDRRPPLVLDDPFVTLDDARAARALELLREVASRTSR